MNQFQGTVQKLVEGTVQKLVELLEVIYHVTLLGYYIELYSRSKSQSRHSCTRSEQSLLSLLVCIC
jgi:hypothetical protein